MWRSETSIPYYLKILLGEQQLATRIEETVSEIVKIEKQSSIILDKPVLSAGSFRLYGTGFTKNKAVSSLSITRSGNTLSWGFDVTGFLKVVYKTEYDLVNLTVAPGEEGKLADASVLGFYNGLVEELQLETPETIVDEAFDRAKYCDKNQRRNGTLLIVPDETLPPWVTTITEYRCRCSDELAYEVTSRAPTKDEKEEFWQPGIKKYEFGEYLNCNRPYNEIHSPDFYKEVCCEEKPEDRVLPECYDTYSKNNGGAEPTDAVKKSLLDKYYPFPVNFIAVLPKTGDCGETKHKWIVNRRDCCGGVSTLKFTETHDIVAWDQQYRFCIEGGTPPYQWAAVGKGLSIAGNDRCAMLTVNNCFCDPGMVVCNDYCGRSIAHAVTGENGRWVQIPNEENPLFVDGAWYADELGQKLYWRFGNKTFQYTEGSYRVKQTLSFTMANAGTSAYTCGQPCNWDYRCWNYNYVNTTTTSIKLFNPLANGVDGLDINSVRFHDVHGASINVDGDCEDGGLTSGQFSYSTATSWQWQCDGLEDPPTFDEENSAEIIADNSYGTVVIIGGKLPFNVSLEGQGFYLDKQLQLTEGLVDSLSFRIYTSDSCGPCTVTVTDKCERTVVGEVASTNGAWVLVSPWTRVSGVKPNSHGTSGVYFCWDSDRIWCDLYSSTYKTYSHASGWTPRYRIDEWRSHMETNSTYDSIYCDEPLPDYGYAMDIPGYPWPWHWREPVWNQYFCEHISIRRVEEWQC